MRFHDEVSSPKDLELDDIKTEKPDAKELKMAQQLIESFTSDFDPENYRDEYREELLDLLDQKAKGKDVVSSTEAEAPKPTKAPDLMAALEESLAAIKGEEAKSNGSSSKKAKKSSSKSTSKKKPAKKSAAKKKAKAASK
jgi:DNA end-binding protein Ku